MFFEEKCLHAANIFGKIVSFKLIHQSSANCVVIFFSGEWMEGITAVLISVDDLVI